MAAIDFPSSPAVDQIFAAGNGVSYKWDGDHWITIAATAPSGSYLPLSGGTLIGPLSVVLSSLSGLPMLDVPLSGLISLAGGYLTIDWWTGLTKVISLQLNRAWPTFEFYNPTNAVDSRLFDIAEPDGAGMLQFRALNDAHSVIQATFEMGRDGTFQSLRFNSTGSDYRFNGVPVMSQPIAGFLALANPSDGQYGLYIGGPADRTNYHRSAKHLIQSLGGGTTWASIDAASFINFYMPTSVHGDLGVVNGNIVAYQTAVGSVASLVRAKTNSDAAYGPAFLSMWRVSASDTGAIPANSAVGGVRFEGLGTDNAYAFYGALNCDILGPNLVGGGKTDLTLWMNIGGSGVEVMRWSGNEQQVRTTYLMQALTPSAAAFNNELVTASWVRARVQADIGYLDQTVQAGAYTTVLGDAGGSVYHAVGAGAALYTIPNNATLPYTLGTTITFVNDSATAITIAVQATDTLVLSPGTTTGTRTLAQGGVATAYKATATRWLISGTGLT